MSSSAHLLLVIRDAILEGRSDVFDPKDVETCILENINDIEVLNSISANLVSIVHGYGYGYGRGNGYGSGYGDRYGNGYGNGSGYGDGYGDGYGYGNGYGNERGNGDGYGYGLLKYHFENGNYVLRR